MKALFALLIASLMVAGCTGPATTSTDDAPVTPSTDAEGRYVIKATSRNTFEPANAKVPVGATVVWINEGGVHNVVEDGGAFTSGSPSSDEGTLFEHTFTGAGSFSYHCQPHRSLGMVGTVTVE